MGRLKAALAAGLLTMASGHTTFKLPAAPGVPGVALYPNTAPSGGYGAHRLRDAGTGTRRRTRRRGCKRAGAHGRERPTRRVLQGDHFPGRPFTRLLPPR